MSNGGGDEKSEIEKLRAQLEEEKSDCAEAMELMTEAVKVCVENVQVIIELRHKLQRAHGALQQISASVNVQNLSTHVHSKPCIEYGLWLHEICKLTIAELERK